MASTNKGAILLYDYLIENTWTWSKRKTVDETIGTIYKNLYLCVFEIHRIRALFSKHTTTDNRPTPCATWHCFHQWVCECMKLNTLSIDSAIHNNLPPISSKIKQSINNNLYFFILERHAQLCKNGSLQCIYTFLSVA